MLKVSKIEKIGIALGLIGLVMMFQPFEKTLFTYGFYLMGIGAFIFSLSGYLPVRNSRGETTLKDLVKWFIILAGVIIFFVVLTTYVIPYTV